MSKALPSAFELAEAFIEALDGYLTVDQLDRVRERNEAETDPAICHSHDFCDANQAMIDALSDFGIEYDGQDDEQAKLIGMAWARAKSAGFDAEQLRDDDDYMKQMRG